MKQTFQAALLALITLCPALAAAAPPTEAQLHELLSIMDARKLIDGMWGQVEAMNRDTIQKLMAGKSLSAEQRKVIDDMQVRMLALMHEELSWEVFEPMILDVYARTFTQDEVEGMLVFYRSDAGKAVIAKMPLVMTNTLQAVQSRMEPLQAKLLKVEHEAMQQLKAGGTSP